MSIDRELCRLRAELARVRRRMRAGALVVVPGLVAAISLAAGRSPSPPRNDDVLRVRGLVVVDARGTERVVIGAPLPDPRMLGRRLPRGGTVHGVLLFDEEGNERGGYVTADGYPNVFLTLDGLDRQAALFIAEPHGVPSLQLFDTEGDMVSLRAGGGPHLTLSKDGNVVAELPSGVGR